MVQILEQLTLSGMYDHDTTRVLVPEQKQQVDQVVQQTRLAGRARGIKWLSLSEVATHQSIPDLPVLFCDYVEELRGHRAAERVLGQREACAKSTKIEIYNSVANYFQPFKRPLEIEKRLLRCIKETGKNQLLSHDIWVHESEDRDKNSFQGRKVYKPLLYFSFSPSKVAIPQTSQRNKSLVAERLELVMLVGTKYTTESSKPNRFHGFVKVVLNDRDRHIDLETYYYVY
ncbi:hypothetical protein HOY80DRAFT_1001502 [Tuber brumale]|nr:hypothetical protein HOY80DRAFT_1001502 [Tuber brumale]